MSFIVLGPEVAGGHGPKTLADRTVHPPRVARLHYELAGWLGDDLLESFPCFVVTARLADRLASVRLSGFRLDDVLITTSDEFKELYPARSLPDFRWLKITGRPGVDDFGLTPDQRLVVSDAALAVLGTLQITHAEQSPYTP